MDKSDLETSLSLLWQTYEPSYIAIKPNVGINLSLNHSCSLIFSYSLTCFLSFLYGDPYFNFRFKIFHYSIYSLFTFYSYIASYYSY